MKIVFRTDASFQIGTGHVMRCLALADKLAELKISCLFVCRPHEGHMLDTIRQRGHEAYGLPPASSAPDASPPIYASWLGCGWKEDAAQTKLFIQNIRPDWLIIDHYALDESWEKAVRLSDTRLMVIDDLTNRRHNCDILLNQNLGAQAADYVALVQTHSRLLIGPRYALLRPEFAAIRANIGSDLPNAPIKNNWLACVGGIDPHNILEKIVAAWKTIPDPKPSLDISVGANSPNIASLMKSVSGMAGITLHTQTPRFADLMARADVLIGTTGTISWERCCLGLPSIMGIVADNQRKILEALTKARTGISLGVWQDISPEKIAGLCMRLMNKPRLLKQMSRRASCLVDGKGTSRVTSLLTEKRPEKLNEAPPQAKKVLFLGYGPNETKIVDALIAAGFEVWHTRDKISNVSGYASVISFGYKHIIGKSVIDTAAAPIVNLHISYLPYNRGYHPNFWSFFDRTPAGVTIHFIDQGVDTGPILVQKRVNFNRDEKTFAQTYRRLITEIEDLFLAHMNQIVSHKIRATPQQGTGTFHRMVDLPKEFLGWDSPTDSEIIRLHALMKFPSTNRSDNA